MIFLGALSCLFFYYKVIHAPPSTASQINAKQIESVLKANPNLVLDAIKDNPQPVLEALLTQQKVNQEKEFNEQMARIRDDEIKTPKKPVLIPGRPALPGSAPDAPITMVVYGSFQCPKCVDGSKITKELLAKYPGKLKVYYKHMTGGSQLAFQQALFLEAALALDPEKAWQLRDYMFEQMDDIKVKGLDAISAYALSIGLDLKAISAGMQDQKTINNLRSDHAEAIEFKLQFTPTYIINGISVSGAKPMDEYTWVIDHFLKK